jgi:glycosyltransferase involved in cell wall biosynthesis
LLLAKQIQEINTITKKNATKRDTNSLIMQSDKKIKVAYLTNILPNYRRGLSEKLFQSKEILLDVYAQNETHGIKSVLNEVYPDNIKEIKYVDFLGNRLTWQFLPWLHLYKNYDIIKVDGNPRVLTHFFIATIFRLLGKKVILYSMLHSFQNNKLNKLIRITWMRLFKYHLLYNEDEIKILKENGFSNKVMTAYNNGLDQKLIEAEKNTWTEQKLKDWKVENKIEGKIDLLACGRTTIGKYEHLLDAIHTIKVSYPNILCYIIGAGNGLEILKTKIEQLGLETNVRLAGEIYEENKLAPYFISTNFFVHPFAIGLSINHAFGYGLPIITHNNLLEHGPEIVLFQNEINGLSYDQNSTEDLAKKIILLLKDEAKVNYLGKNAYDLVSKKYNVDHMADNLISLIKTINKNN